MFHDVLIAVAFIGIVATPAVVATLGGKKEYEPVPETEIAPRASRREAKVIRPHSTVFIPERSMKLAEATLPVRAHGRNNR